MRWIKRNLIFVIFVIYILSATSAVFNSFPVDEQITVLLPFSPGLVCEISGTGENIFCAYGVGSTPRNFVGKINDYGAFKTGIGFWRAVYTVVFQEKTYLPVMIHPGEGYLYYYVNKLFTFCDAYDLNAIRIHSIAIGFLTLFLLWLFLKDFLGLKTANLAALLLAVNNAFLNSKGIFLFSDNYTHCLALGILLLLWKYKKTSRISYLYLCSFVTGLALYQKLTILWFLAALLVLYALNRDKIKINFGLRRLFNCLFFVVLGGLPLVVFNLESGGGSFMSLGSKFLGGARGLSQIIPAIWSNLLLFFSFLKEYPLETAILAIAALIFVFFRKEILAKENKQSGRFLFILLLPIVIFLMISLSTYGRDVSSYHHYELLIQFFVMAEAAIFVSFWELSSSRRLTALTKKLSFAVIVLVITFQFIYFISDLGNLPGRPGKEEREFLDREDKNEIIDYLEANNINDPVFFDYNNVGTHSFLSKGKIRVINYFLVFAFLGGQDRRDVLKKIISINPKAVFIFPLNRGIYYPAKKNDPKIYEDFLELKKVSGLLLQTEKRLSFDDEMYIAVGLRDNK